MARAISNDRRIPWIATWLFFSITWVGQDYFSPQAVNFLFFLAFMNILLHFFRTDRAALPRGLSGAGSRVRALAQWTLRIKDLRPGGAAVQATSTIQRALLIVTLLTIYAASVFSHQLTPFFLLLEVIVLVALRRVALRGFPLLMGVIVFTYISFGAVAFWSGHFDDVFGGFGQVGAVAEQNVGAKVGQPTNHVYVIYGRLALTAALWTVAAYGLFRRLRRGRTDIAAMVGFLAPFLVLAGQSYGGEAILRVFLFSLPFAAILAVLALLPTEAVKLNGLRAGLIVVIASLLVPAFMLTRFGNEQYEYVTKNEYVAAQKLREIVPVGSQLVGISTNTPWRISGEGLYSFSMARGIAPYDDPNKVYQAVALKGTRSSYLFISRSQLQQIASDDNRSPDWGVAFKQSLVDSGRFIVAYENPDATILRLTTTPMGARLMTTTTDTQVPASQSEARVSELANIVNLLMIPAAVALLVMVLTDTQGDIRLWLTVLIFIFGAGSGVVQFLRLPTAAMQFGILVAISGALDILIAQGLLTINNINDAAAVCLLAGFTCVRPLRLNTNDKAAR